MFSDMTGKRPKRVNVNPKIPISKAAKRFKKARDDNIIVDNNNSPMISENAPVEDFLKSLLKVRFHINDITIVD